MDDLEITQEDAPAVKATPSSVTVHQVANWPDTIRGLGVCAFATALAWRHENVSEFAMAIFALVASPSLARTFLERFRR